MKSVNFSIFFNTFEKGVEIRVLGKQKNDKFYFLYHLKKDPKKRKEKSKKNPKKLNFKVESTYQIAITSRFV